MLLTAIIQKPGIGFQGHISSLQVASTSVWSNLFWLVIIFLLLLLLNRWITMHVNGVGLIISMNQAVATWFYFFLFLPGILIHELSHYLVAILLRAKPSKFSLWPKAKRGRVVLGSVEVKKADPVAHSLIGVAPLIFGSLAVWWIAQFLQFDRLGQALSSGNTDTFLRAVGYSLTTPDFWLWLYLLFAISNAMLPSPADRIYWRPVLIFFGGLTILLIGFDIFPTIPDFIQTTFFSVISILVFALTTAVAVDLFFALCIFLLESALSLTTGRKIQY